MDVLMFRHRLVTFVKSHCSVIFLIILILFYLFNGIQYLKSQSITSDEGSFYDYAKRYLKGNPDRIYPRSDNSKMPVIVLNTIPRVAEQFISPGLKKNDWGISDTMEGRYITLLVSVLTIVVVFSWAKQLYGYKAGLFAAFLMSFCPNNLANAALVTTDSYSVLFLLVSMYCLWRFCTLKNVKSFILFSLVVALSQLVKQSLFHLYVLVPLVLIIYAVVQKPVIKFKKCILYMFLFLLINWFVINAGYYFHGSNTALGEYNFMSHLFQSVQSFFPKGFIIPLPKPFVDGLDMAKYYDQIGGGIDKVSSFGKVTILGHESTGGSFWYYYFVSIFFKTPIPYFFFFFCSVIFLIKNNSSRSFFKNEFFLLFPVLYYLIVMSFLYKTQCGLRHLILIFPFIFILSSACILYLKNSVGKITLAVATVFLIVSVLRYWKNYYPYTNEFIIDKKNAYAYVGSSNLEFLQGKYFFDAYLKNHPNVRRISENPQTGIFLIDTEEYLDVWNRHQYDWVRNIPPLAHVAYNGLLIKVEKDDLPGSK